MGVGRKPDYKVKVSTKGSDKPKYGFVGAAWKGKDGQISIMLQAGTRLSWDDELWINLIPADESSSRFKNDGAYTRNEDKPSYNDLEDEDVPF